MDIYPLYSLLAKMCEHVRSRFSCFVVSLVREAGAIEEKYCS